MDRDQQALLVRIMDLFAERFDKRAVLRGGMVLRVLGCERLTNDLDYVLVPHKSKKEVVPDVMAVLGEIEGADVEYSLNSKCLRIHVTVADASIQIEVKTAMHVPTEVASTANLAREFGRPPRLIAVVDHSIALADKMAAWNERRLMRDMYDIWFFLRMGVRPDRETLARRLRKCVYSRFVKEKDRFKGEGVDEFFEFLRGKARTLTDEDIAAELADYLTRENTAGLSMMFRAELAKL